MNGFRVSRRECLALAGGVLAGFPALRAAAAGLKSGPQLGERPLPFTSNLVTGPHSGKQHCYVCEMKDELAVLVFARKMDEPTARLLTELRDVVRENQRELVPVDGKTGAGSAPVKLFGWFVFLGEDSAASEAALERRAREFARAHQATAIPISVLGDPAGPPGYQIAPEAAVTVVIFRNGKTLYNRAYTAKEWTRGAADRALKELPKLAAAQATTPKA